MRMTDDSGTTDPIGLASSGVEDLAGAVTSVLDQAGPVGALARPVVGALRNVWEGYFGVPLSPGTTNWNAYTHEQLYNMLWQHADVGDVSSVAAEWGRHGSELTQHADTLRGHRDSLQANWTGRAAEPAASRLGELGQRTAGVGTRAGTVAQATQSSGEALAVARNTMPKPPGDPTGGVVGSAAAGAGLGAVIGGLVGAGAGGIGAAPGAAIGAAIGAVAAGGASMFLASAMAAEQKTEAVRVMQRYEASLLHSSQAITPTPPGATDVNAFGASGLATTTAGYVGPLGGGGAYGGGLPWKQLVGAPLAPGALAGSKLGGNGATDGGLLVRAGGLLSEEFASGELAAKRGAGNGMMPGSGLRGHGQEDVEHQNRMPTVDHRLFDVDEKAASPVIGL